MDISSRDWFGQEAAICVVSCVIDDLNGYVMLHEPIRIPFLEQVWNRCKPRSTP